MRACRVLRNAARTSTSRADPCSLANIIHRPASRSAHNHALHQHEPLSVLLRGTLSLLPRTLSTADGTLGLESPLFWSNLLERSFIELDSGSDQPLKATIAGESSYNHPFILEPHCLHVVCGFNKWAGSHSLITALLEDPFSSDPTYTDILRNRWKNAPSCVNIE